jgi:hypothetical protein
MKMNSGDALAKLRALDLAGAQPVVAALVEENQQQSPEVGKRSTRERSKRPRRQPRGSQKGKPTKEPSSRRSHSKGGAAAIVTGYLDPLHVDVLVDLRSRLGMNALSIPSANQVLRVALRLVRMLKPSDAQVLAAYVEEKSEE